MRYLHLWGSFIKNCLAREMEFRENFFMQIIGNLLQFIITIIFFEVIYLYTTNIGGWGIYETLFLVGTSQLINNLYGTFFGLNIPRISEYTRRGDLDFILVKPIDTQFLVSLRYISFSSIISLVFPFLLISYVIVKGCIAFSLPAILIYILLVGCGLLIRYAIGFCVMTLSFWVTRAEALHSLYTDFFSLAGYPASIYQGAIRFFFTFIIPVIIVANFPVMIVIKLLNPIYTLYALGISLLFFMLSRAFFKFAIRYYSSASS